MIVRFDAAADADVSDAYNWYEDQQRGLGEDFLAAVRSAVDMISEFPNAYPVIDGLARRYVLKRFPYSLYYTVQSDTLRIVACFHGHGDPIVWKRRMR